MDINVTLKPNETVNVRVTAQGDDEPTIVRAADHEEKPAPTGDDAQSGTSDASQNGTPTDEDLSTPAADPMPDGMNKANACVPGQEVHSVYATGKEYEELISALLAMFEAGDENEFIIVTGMAPEVEARLRRFLNAKASLPDQAIKRLFIKSE